MKIDVAANYDKMSATVAERMAEIIRSKPDALVCMAAGSTPLGTMQHLVEKARRKEVSFTQARFVSLDEWVDLNGQDEGSCRYTLDRHFFSPLQIPEEHICFFNGRSHDLAGECVRIDRFIQAHGRIDVMVLGIGLNGHLGFNEPGARIDAYSHIAELDPVTRTVSAKYFSKPVQVELGITLGMAHIMEANEVFLLANGDLKAEIIKLTVEGDMQARIPASLLQGHKRVELFLDQAAASLLS